MIINWLVFSDLHFQFNNVKSQIAREKLPQFISNMSAEFILIAGDCFYKYSEGMDINPVADYIHSICSAVSLGRENVYITPGNHDLVRTELRLSLLNYYTGYNYETGEKIRNCRELSGEALEVLLSKKSFSGFCELYKKVIGKQYSSPYKVFEKENYRILNINTCVLSGGYYSGNDLSKKNIRFDEENLSVINKEFKDIVNQIPDDDKINIALMHHGVKYLRKEEQTEFEHMMEDKHIDVVFAGHSHKIGVYPYSTDSRNLQEFTCGAPIIDDYSEPSFYKCMFDTDSKELSIELYSYSEDANDWVPAINSKVRKFDRGIYRFVPDRFKGAKIIRSEETQKNKSVIDNSSIEHFNKFGIIDALPLRDFINYRNKLIKEAEGNVILVGQSLENAFDIRKDSESIVESIKSNKKIKNLDIFLTDPIMFDSSTETYGEDTPILRIGTTMHTILYHIATSLSADQSINIYFIPLVQLDHMVFANNILLLRHTLLWTNDNHYKATPLICKNMGGTGVNESIVKSSMYNVYAEYINKLKEESIEINIQEQGANRSKETLAKIRHRQWRHRLYVLRNSGDMKGQINMHKLYRTQLISDLHSSWDPRFRSFSSEINWVDDSEMSSFNVGIETSINSHEELYKCKNLLDDATQKILLPYIKETELLLNKLVKTYDKKAFAKIYPSLDIGIPNNILRLAGGFATGMLVVWKCGTPIVPIDTTVNVCSSSYYQFDSAALRGEPIDKFFNYQKINNIINEGSKKEGLAFSFNTGNHFLLLCKGRKSKMYYLVLHSSAKQFKDTYLGLYPKPENWYSGYVKTMNSSNSNRYIRYLKDDEAKQFISIARMLNRENEDIHNWFAKKFCNKINFIRQKTYHHYGMPTDYSIAIGTYVVDNKDVVPIFSREGYPIWLFRPDEKMWSIELEGKRKYIIPHGWGQKICYDYFNSIKNEEELSMCKFDICNGKLVLKNGKGEVLKDFELNYSLRFPDEMVEVRKLWEADESELNMLKYKNYLSGKVEDILEPIALFSKNNDGVKYYDNGKGKPLIFS